MNPFVVVFSFEEGEDIPVVIEADDYEEAVEAALLLLPLGEALSLTVVRAIQVEAMPECDLPEIEYGV